MRDRRRARALVRRVRVRVRLAALEPDLSVRPAIIEGALLRRPRAPVFFVPREGFIAQERVETRGAPRLSRLDAFASPPRLFREPRRVHHGRRDHRRALLRGVLDANTASASRVICLGCVHRSGGRLASVAAPRRGATRRDDVPVKRGVSVGGARLVPPTSTSNVLATGSAHPSYVSRTQWYAPRGPASARRRRRFARSSRADRRGPPRQDRRRRRSPATTAA